MTRLFASRFVFCRPRCGVEQFRLNADRKQSSKEAKLNNHDKPYQTKLFTFTDGRNDFGAVLSRLDGRSVGSSHEGTRIRLSGARPADVITTWCGGTFSAMGRQASRFPS